MSTITNMAAVRIIDAVCDKFNMTGNKHRTEIC